MAVTNYSNLSLAQLRSERSKIDKAIEFLETKNKKDAMAKLRDIAKDAGIDLNELGAGAASKSKTSKKPAAAGKTAARKKKVGAKRGKVAPKYKNPNDESQVWTGRGRQPLWVQEHLQNGGTLDSITI